MRTAHRAEEPEQQLARAGALEAGEPHDLARPHVEGHRVDDAASSRGDVDLFDAQAIGQPGEGVGRRCRTLVRLRCLASADPAQQERRRYLRRGRRAHSPAVAQHGDALGHLIDLLHAMRDVHDRAAMRAQIEDASVQLRDIWTGERAGRLVHHDDAGVAVWVVRGPALNPPRTTEVQRLGDLDQLPRRWTELADRPIGIDVETEALERPHRRLSLGATAHETERTGGPAAEEEIVGGAERRHQRELLMDDRDPERARLAR
jgi:hypothetical protein